MFLIWWGVHSLQLKQNQGYVRHSTIFSSSPPPFSSSSLSSSWNFSLAPVSYYSRPRRQDDAEVGASSYLQSYANVPRNRSFTLNFMCGGVLVRAWYQSRDTKDEIPPSCLRWCRPYRLGKFHSTIMCLNCVLPPFPSHSLPPPKVLLPREVKHRVLFKTLRWRFPAFLFHTWMILLIYHQDWLIHCNRNKYRCKRLGYTDVNSQYYTLTRAKTQLKKLEYCCWSLICCLEEKVFSFGSTEVKGGVEITQVNVQV